MILQSVVERDFNCNKGHVVSQYRVTLFQRICSTAGDKFFVTLTRTVWLPFVPRTGIEIVFGERDPVDLVISGFRVSRVAWWNELNLFVVEVEIIRSISARCSANVLIEQGWSVHMLPHANREYAVDAISGSDEVVVHVGEFWYAATEAERWCLEKEGLIENLEND